MHETSLMENDEEGRSSLAWVWLETGLILLVFFLHAGWPVPDPNEPYYLCKAKHTWEPEWLAGDAFLESRDAHLVFFWLCGWWAKFLSLPAMAWTGRLVTWFLLAWSWRRLCQVLVPRWGAALLSAIIYAALTERYHMAGEWVIGGFESKGLAYALVFFALADWLEGRPVRWGIWLGLGTALHVLAGGWNLVALGLAWMFAGRFRPDVKSFATGLAISVALALPGLWPTLALNQGLDAETLRLANQIYFARVDHHLDLTAFRPDFVTRHFCLVAVWVILSIPLYFRQQARERRLVAYVYGVLAITFCGVLLTFATQPFPEMAHATLRYYWFRLSDACIPLGVSLAGVSLFVPVRGSAEWRHLMGLTLLFGFATFHLADCVTRPFEARPRADKPGKVANYPDWREACLWIRGNTPSDARFLTPRTCQTFKWNAQRSELVTAKDVPQDAAGLVEWRQRLEDVFWVTEPCEPRHWYNTPGEIPIEHLQRLARHYGFQYVITETRDPLPGYPLFQNKTYAVYRLPMQGD